MFIIVIVLTSFPVKGQGARQDPSCYIHWENMQTSMAGGVEPLHLWGDQHTTVLHGQFM